MIRRPGLAFVAACLLAVLLRLMLPAGWMPASNANGPVLSLCSGLAAPGAAPADAGLPGGGDRPCDFALATGPALAAVVILLALPILPPLTQPAPFPLLLRPVRHRARPPGQGPPRA